MNIISLELHSNNLDRYGDWASCYDARGNMDCHKDMVLTDLPE